LPAKRVTFVIDSGGTIRKSISAELDVSAHAREALEALRDLAA
jgi:peroxiredoxin